MSPTFLDASELKGRKPTTIEQGLAMASVTRRVGESNMPNVCYSSEHLVRAAQNHPQED